MNLAELLEIGKQLEHQQRFYKGLTESLDILAKSESILNENAQRKDVLQKEIAKLENEKKKLQSEIDSKISSDGVAYGDFQKEMAVKMEELGAALERRNEEYAVAKQKLQDALDGKTEEYRTAFEELKNKKAIIDMEEKDYISTHEKKMADLQDHATKEEAKLAKTLKALEAIKAKI